MKPSYSLPILLCLVLSVGSAAAEEPSIFNDPYNWRHPDAVRVSDKELVFTDKRAAKFKNESLYFTGLFDNGWAFTLGFFGWTQGIFRGYGAYALIGTEEGKRYWVSFPLKRKNIEFGKDHLLIRSDKVYFEGSGMEYRAAIESAALSLDLYFENILPPWKPGDGYVYPTKDRTVFTRISVPCPWADVRGTVTIGGKSQAVRGQGYGDLTFLVSPANRSKSKVYLSRVFSPPGTERTERFFLSQIDYVSHPAYGSIRQPILLLARGDRWLFTSRDYSLNLDDFAETSEGSYPRTYMLQAENDGYLLRGEYRTGKLYDITDMFAEIPPVFRGLVGLFIGRHINFHSLGQFRGTLTYPDGVVEELSLIGLSEYLIVR